MVKQWVISAYKIQDKKPKKSFRYKTKLVSDELRFSCGLKQSKYDLLSNEKVIEEMLRKDAVSENIDKKVTF